MSTAIDHFRPVRLPALIELLSSDVACTLRFTDRGKREGDSSTCEILLANKSQVTVSGRLYGVDRRRRSRDFGELTVIAGGIGSSVFCLPPGSDECDRLYLEVVGDGVRLSADARIAAKRARSPFPTLIAGGGVLAIGVVAAASALLIERPSITAFGAPRTVQPGVMTAMYAIGGQGSGTFAATAQDGTLLASGALSAASGSIPIAIPARVAGQTVRVSLDISGPFGRAQKDVEFAVSAPPTAAPAVAASLAGPRIAYFTAHREQYAGRASVLASYQASGTSGTLRVRDERGKVVGSAPFSHVGTSRIPLNEAAANEVLRAEIDVQRSGRNSTAAVEIPASGPVAGVADTAAAQAGAARSVAAHAPDEGGSQPTPTDPFFVEQRVIAGRPFTVEIRYPMPNLRISLQTTTGTTIDEVSVPADAREVTLRAPASAMVEIYYLGGTFSRASSEETLVRSLRIYPD